MLVKTKFRGVATERLILKLASVQNINPANPTTIVDLDFSNVVENTIENCIVHNNGFNAHNNTYKGVFTLPKGRYSITYKINVEGDGARRNGVASLARYIPSIAFYPDVTSYTYTRGANNVKYGTLSCPKALPEYLNLEFPESFGMTAARANSNRGTLNTIPEQSFLIIEKI
jgi:hypothetical protein